MKKLLLILLPFLFTFSFVKAQEFNGQRGEKIQALKIAFLTQRLHLTSSEAEKFWPVYNQYDREIRDLRRNSKNGDVIETEQDLVNIRKKYKPSFEKVIGPQRVNDLFNAEKEFRNLLIRRLKNQRQQRSE